VAERAVALAAAAGVTLPDDLSLWALAGHRPPVPRAPRPGPPEELGSLLEDVSGRAVRRRSGMHFTPPPVADGLVARAIGERARPTVGDPACGGGALLLAAGRALVARGEAPGEVVARLFGADVDPLAVATTEVALLLWSGCRPPPGQLVEADTLVEVPWGPVDVVVGNPPFLSPLGVATGRSSTTTRRLRVRFGDAVRAYTDAAGLFLLVGLDLVGDAGTVAMLQPQSVLGSRDASEVRRTLEARATVREVWVPDRAGFAHATVAVCALVLDRRPAPVEPTDVVTWSAHLARADGVPPVDLRTGRTVADVATVVAAFRHEYYGMAPHVREAHDAPGGRPLVTTGLVDLGAVAWGRRSARVGGTRWRAPVIDEADLEGRAAVWAARTHRPKVLLASQTQVVEVAVDGEGAWLPGVPLVAVLAERADLWRLAAALAAPPVVAWAAARTAGTARSRGALKLGAPLVRELPLPVDDAAWAEGAAALEHGDLAAFATAMTAAYAVAPQVAAWWCERAKVGCPPAPALR
jgi:hypothetical protein